MRFLVAIILWGVVVQCAAQDLNKADLLFDNYEFKLASELYAPSYANNKLNTERTEKLAYCYLRIGENSKGITLIDSIITTQNKEYEFYLWKASFERELGRYDESIESITKYKNLGGPDDISLFVESCELLRDGFMPLEGEVVNHEWNDRFASKHVSTHLGDLFLLEQGLDSAGNNLGIASQSAVFSQAFLMRPYFQDGDQLKEWRLLPEGDFENHTIRSISIVESTNKVYFISNNPLKTTKVDLKLILYEAKLNGLTSELSEISPLSFYGDSIVPLQVTLNLAGNAMIFSAMYNDRSDLFVSYLSDGKWGGAEPIGSINTNMDDLYPVLIGDSILSFSSNGRPGFGALDIFMCEIQHTNPIKLGSIQHLPAPINSTKDDFQLQFVSTDSLRFVSNRLTGNGDDDIWTFIYPPKPIKEEPKINFEELISEWHLKRIYFDFDLSVSEDDIDFVEPLVDLLNKGADLKIKLVGHTDSRGTDKYNYELGLKRAVWVKEQLENKGIGSSRISFESVGADELVNHCTREIFWCSEKQHQDNRFVQLFLSLE